MLRERKEVKLKRTQNKQNRKSNENKMASIFERCFAVVKREGCYVQCSHRRGASGSAGDSFCKRHQKGQTHGKIFICYKDEDYLVKWQCEIVTLERKLMRYTGKKQIRYLIQSIKSYLIKTYGSWKDSKTVKHIMRYKYDMMIQNLIYEIMYEKRKIEGREDEDDEEEEEEEDSLSSASTVVLLDKPEEVFIVENDDVPRLKRKECHVCYNERYVTYTMPCCQQVMCVLCWERVCYFHRDRCPYCRHDMPSLINHVRQKKENDCKESNVQ